MTGAGRAGVGHWGWLILLLAAGGHAAAQDGGLAQPEMTNAAAETPIERGRRQTELAEFDDAQESYLAGIGLLAAEHGEYSPILIEPYTELARVYRLNRQPAEAIAVLEEARHVSQRNFGLFNLEQTPLLDALGDAYLLAGDTLEAQNVQRERLTVAVRQFGEDDPRTVPFRNHLADYYDRSRMRIRAREEYAAVAAIQREHFGENDGRLLIPLSRMAAIDLVLGGSGSARGRLQAVLESSANATHSQRAHALAVLGDGELVRRRVEAAHGYYRQAYEALEAEEPSLAAEFFAAPRFIDFVPPPSPVDRRSSRRGGRRAYDWGSITARFDVSADGRAANVAVTLADPAGLLDDQYVRRLAEARFRPRLAHGEPAATASVAYDHEFRYFVEDRR